MYNNDTINDLLATWKMKTYMKDKNSHNKTLYNLCCQNDIAGVRFLLQNFNDIDVLFASGWLFVIAISNDNCAICEALLSFFETKQNPNEEQKEELRGVLLSTMPVCPEISREIQLVFKKYISCRENSKKDYFDEQDSINFQNCFNSTQSDNSEQIIDTYNTNLIGDTQNHLDKN